jgi:hypothetical protein
MASFGTAFGSASGAITGGMPFLPLQTTGIEKEEETKEIKDVRTRPKCK